MVTCNVCKRQGHTADDCWTVNGYPKWYYKSIRWGTVVRGGTAAGRGHNQRNYGACSANVAQTTVGGAKENHPI